MSTPSYKGSGQPIRSAVGGITEFLGGLFGGAEPSYKTTPTPTQAPAPSPTPTPTQALAPTQAPICPTCPFAAACAALPNGAADPADAVIPVGPGPITIVIQPRV